MLIWALVMAYIVYRYMKKTGLIGQENSGKDQRLGRQMHPGANTRPYPQPTIQNREYQRPAQRQITAADRARLEEYRMRKEAQDRSGNAAPTAAGRNAAGYPVKKASAASSDRKTDILSRAQQNAKKYEADVTLRELEDDHDHRETSKRTIEKAELKRQKDMHPHDAAHVSEAVGAENESILPSIEDLMVKGYEAKLSFERDFVGEGMDMISRFTVPDTIPSAGAFENSR